MSATAQCTKPKTEAAGWTTLFEDVETSCTKSILFMKKLLALGVSNILYWRGFLPESAFGERLVGENSLKILRNEKDCPAALKIISWIKASFEPLSKNWLRNFYLVIRDKDNSTTIETYMFKFQYHNEDQVQTELYRNNKKIPLVEGKTMQMLTNIATIVKPLGPAPFPCMVSIEMDFNQPTPENEIPRDAVIPGFIPVDELSHKFDGRRIAINLGDINTAYHDCKLQIRTTPNKFSVPSSKEQPDSQSVEEHQTTQLADTQQTASLDGSDTQKEKTSSKRPLQSREANREEVNCPCHTEHKDLETIPCTDCHSLHHLVCYGLLDEERHDVISNFSCCRCLYQHSDADVYWFNSDMEPADQCLVRQAVCQLLAGVSGDIIEQNKFVRTILLQDKIIKTNRSGKSYQVNKAVLKKKFNSKYFNTLRRLKDLQETTSPEMVTHTKRRRCSREF